jgi:hypothetical protein
MLLDLERYGRAETVLDKLYTTRVRVLGPDDIFTLNSLIARGRARVWAGKTESGLADVQSALDAAVRLQGPKSRLAFIATRELIEVERVADKLDTAEQRARAALDDIRSIPEMAGAEADFRTQLAGVLLEQGRFDEVLAQVDPVYESRKTGLRAADPKLLEVRTLRAKALAGLHRDAEAGPELEALYTLLEPRYGGSALECRSLARRLAEIAARSGDAAAEARWRGRS